MTRAAFFVASSLAIVSACRGDASSTSGLAVAESARAARAVAASGADDQVRTTVERVLTSAEHPGLKWSDIHDVAPVLTALYNAEPDRLIWFTGNAPDAGLAEALAAISAAAERGLDPADYDAAALAEQWPAVKAATASGPERALFDLMISIAAARMLRGVHVGRVDPATMNWGYDIAEKAFDPAAAFGDARHKGLSATLDALEPRVSHYGRAKRTLAAYRSLASAGEPAAAPELLKGQTKVEPGRTWAGVPQLAARLRVFGDLPRGASISDTTYTGALVDAVRSFQSRHGLEPDGVIGAGTVKAINVPLAQRIRQIELAMERMRWLPELGDRPNIFVNVPLFRLWATDPLSGKEPLRMNVVVGRSLNHKTPIFVEQMEYVIFRPYWNPPSGITVKELVPHQRRDATYFDREQLEIVASGDDNAKALAVTDENLAAVVAGKLHVRQRPGPANSLGLVKFIFPNAENVYMHGTPAPELFARARRDFSHGCVRLEDPARFAEWVLRDNPDWPRQKIDAAMKGERPTRVNLKQPLTVVLFYDTVHVNSEGVVFFADDIYAHDRALDAALVRGYPYAIKKP
jgi:L,D-transpeptidase YcbB